MLIARFSTDVYAWSNCSRQDRLHLSRACTHSSLEQDSYIICLCDLGLQAVL